MSRRSVLLATTFYIAIGSLAAVGPASAHGFGGVGSFAFRSPAVAYMAQAPIQSMGNYGGDRFGHAPSVGSPASQSSGAVARLQTSHILPVANAPVGNGAALIQSRVSAAGIISSPVKARYPVNQPNGAELGLSSRTNSAEADGKLPKPGSSEGVPNVTGAPRIIGQGSSPEHGLGSSGVKNDGPTINLPGTQGLGQKGPREVPGLGDATNGPQINLPGSIDRHGPDAANKAISKMDSNDKQLLDAANKGGPNSVNLPTSPGAGIAVSDDTSGKKSGSGGSSKASGSGNSLSAGPGIYGSGGTSPTKDGGTVTVSTMQDKGTTYQVVTTKDKDGNITGMTYSEKGPDGKIKTTSTGPEIPAKKDKMPSDDDSGTIGSLNPSSGVGKMGHGGGTDNNGTEASGGKSSQLANGTSLGSIGHGDGTGTHGDNNGVDKSGVLAAGTSLARKDYGDGGGSDNRDGGTSLAAPKVGSGGGDPHQKAAAAMGD
jgi:hypothetical protein